MDGCNQTRLDSGACQASTVREEVVKKSSKKESKKALKVKKSSVSCASKIFVGIFSRTVEDPRKYSAIGVLYSSRALRVNSPTRF